MAKKTRSIYDPVSPSDTYVIYDQFHINTPSHFHETVKGWESALARYQFHKVFHPECVLGLCTLEYYNHKMESYS